jgi:cathepsin L
MKLLFVVTLAVLIAGCVAINPDEKTLQSLFTKWMHEYNKVYEWDEFSSRYGKWKQNYLYITEFNRRDDVTFTLAMNEFGDLTNEEFHKFYLGYQQKPLNPVQAEIVVEQEPLPGLPTSWDWRTKGVVTGVKNQGQCGSCWSFSATGSMEGAHAIKTGNLVGLSEQNLVDCSDAEGNQGCNGGLMDYAFQYVITNNGIDSEASYPYTAEDGTCHYSVSNRAATISSYHNIPSGSESALTNAVYSVGPVSVAIDASLSSFQFYSGGVYYAPDCSSTALDHGVLSVGFGIDGTQDYYIVKNSWGTSWGLNGYIWMSRNRNNNCGIATAASYPIV